MIYVLIILLIVIFTLLYYKTKEYHDYYTSCESCSNKNYYQCRNCKDCGVCVTELNDMYCIKGDLNGPENNPTSEIKFTNDKTKKTDKNTIYCERYYHGNIWPQYDTDYYSTELNLKNDARYYPHLKFLDDKYNTNLFNSDNIIGNYYTDNNYDYNDNDNDNGDGNGFNLDYDDPNSDDL